jgi:hypothetical protein
MHSHTKNQVNISNQSEKKVVTTKYLANFQSPRAHNSAKNHWTGTQQNVNLLCNLSLYTHTPNIKSISQSIAKKSGDNCFISEMRTWVTIKIIVLWDIDLIFGLWVYNNKLQIQFSFSFVPVQWFLAESCALRLWKLAK